MHFSEQAVNLAIKNVNSTDFGGIVRHVLVLCIVTGRMSTALTMLQADTRTAPSGLYARTSGSCSVELMNDGSFLEIQFKLPDSPQSKSLF